MAVTSCWLWIFLEFQDVVLNLAALVEERVKKACQHQLSGLSGDETEHWGPGARIWPATPAAVPPTPQLLLIHLQSSLSCHSASHSICLTVYRLSEYHMNLQYSWPWDYRSQKSLCINGTWHNSDICMRGSVLNRSRLSKHIYFGHSLLYLVNVLCLYFSMHFLNMQRQKFWKHLSFFLLLQCFEGGSCSITQQ